MTFFLLALNILNFYLDVKFEDKFRYIIKENNITGYGIYDIKGKSVTNKIRIIEFPGFSSDVDENKSIVDKIHLKIV